MNLEPVGYSGVPLAKKLGLTPGTRYRIFGGPDGFSTALAELQHLAIPRESELDVALLFATERTQLESLLPSTIGMLKKDGGLWVCWPKKASKIPTDVTEDLLRTLILPLGLVDNKVCAVTEVWSGLRFVWRKELR